MTLGEIIKEYADEHSMTAFLKDSGISKAYAYMLINNKNNKGEPIVPSIETIGKVAHGVHQSFDDVFTRLDYDFLVRVNTLDTDILVENYNTYEDLTTRKKIKELVNAANGCTDNQIDIAINMLNTFKQQS